MIDHSIIQGIRQFMNVPFINICGDINSVSQFGVPYTKKDVVIPRFDIESWEPGKVPDEIQMALATECPDIGPHSVVVWRNTIVLSLDHFSDTYRLRFHYHQTSIEEFLDWLKQRQIMWRDHAMSIGVGALPATNLTMPRAD